MVCSMSRSSFTSLKELHLAMHWMLHSRKGNNERYRKAKDLIKTSESESKDKMVAKLINLSVPNIHVPCNGTKNLMCDFLKCKGHIN